MAFMGNFNPTPFRVVADAFIQKFYLPGLNCQGITSAHSVSDEIQTLAKLDPLPRVPIHPLG